MEVYTIKPSIADAVRRGSFALPAVIIVMEKLVPRYAGLQRKPQVRADEIPSLQRSLGILWRFWKIAADNTLNAHFNGLHYHLALIIANLNTKAIIWRDLDNKDKTLSLWPEVELSMDNDGRASWVCICFGRH